MTAKTVVFHAGAAKEADSALDGYAQRSELAAAALLNSDPRCFYRAAPFRYTETIFAD
jgi:hypothetical protein